MLRFMPNFAMSFAPMPGFEFDMLILASAGGRRRSSAQSLLSTLPDGDPLPDPFPESDPDAPERTLPTPRDVPAPSPTDVPAPEPWDVPPPDPADPRPKSIP